MNLILLNKNDFVDDNKILISGRRAEHIISVHKASIARELTVGLINGNIGTGTVTHVSDNEIEMDVTLSITPPSPLPLKLIVALPRPKTLKKVLHIATALGIKNIYLIETWKVEKSYWQSPLLETEEIRKHLVLGLEQAKDTVLPKVTLKRRFKPFVEDELPNIIKNTAPFIAQPSDIPDCPYNFNDPATLAIGPEGGFTEYEVNKLAEQGFNKISIGKRIHRVEFAIPIIVGRLF
jgi:16S rRNA (uracil1498-N3)-methyltransferase